MGTTAWELPRSNRLSRQKCTFFVRQLPLWNVGTGGASGVLSPKILVEQLALSQPGAADYA